MPPLLQRLTERKPENLDYLGVSYGLTPQLLRYVYILQDTFVALLISVAMIRFWKRAGYVPLYIRQTTSELTGEHACVMVRGLNSSVESELDWLGEFAQGWFDIHISLGCSMTDLYADFRKRFTSLLSFKFRDFGSVTALSLLEATNSGVKKLDEDGSKGWLALSPRVA